MKNKVVIVIFVLILAFALGACTASTDIEDLVTPNVMTLKGPTGVSMVKMIEDNSQSEAYEIRVVGNPEEIVAAISSGSADMAAIPTNLAAKLYAKTDGEVVMIAINTYGSLYILEIGDTIQTMEDLEGKTLYASGQGANPQYILKNLLAANDLTVGKDVTVEYKSEHTELATLIASGEVDMAMLPEPFVSTVISKNDDVRIALDLNNQWAEAKGGQLTMSCVAASKSFVEEHPDAVAAFLVELEQSVNFAVNDIEETSALCVKYDIIANEAIATAAIPQMGLTFISDSELEPAVSGYFTMLFDADPASIGGAMPEQDFYYSK